MKTTPGSDRHLKLQKDMLILCRDFLHEDKEQPTRERAIELFNILSCVCAFVIVGTEDEGCAFPLFLEILVAQLNDVSKHVPELRREHQNLTKGPHQ